MDAESMGRKMVVEYSEVVTASFSSEDALNNFRRRLPKGAVIVGFGKLPMKKDTWFVDYYFTDDEESES